MREREMAMGGKGKEGKLFLLFDKDKKKKQ